MRRRPIPAVCLLIVTLLFPVTANAQELLTFEKWKTNCLAAPTNRTLQGRMPQKAQLPLPTFAIADDLATQLLKHFQKSNLAEPSNWVGEKPKADEFFDIERSYYSRSPIPFQPFAQKVDIPAGSKVIFHGDLHGDIRSLISTLDWLNENDYADGFKLKNPNTYFVFLGDYVDRGSYGIEVLYTLMRLKLENPNHVLMARGNHEDFKMTATYGFLREGQMKYGREFNPTNMWRMYDFLPVVIYVGVDSNYVQCNHGGMEPGYDQRSLLNEDQPLAFEFLGELKQKTFALDHPQWLSKTNAETKAMTDERLEDFRPKSPISPNPIGFMWNDFFVFKDEPTIGFNSSRLAFNHGQASTNYLLSVASSETAKLRAVFRAHQHSGRPNPAMNRIVASNGAFRHWQAADSSEKANANQKALKQIIDVAAKRTVPEGSVWTFNVSPDSLYGEGNNYSFDTIGILHTEKAFADWRLEIVNVPVPQ